MPLADDILRLADDNTQAVERRWLDQAMAEAPYCTLPLLLFAENELPLTLHWPFSPKLLLLLL